MTMYYIMIIIIIIIIGYRFIPICTHTHTYDKHNDMYYINGQVYFAQSLLFFKRRTNS